MGGKSHLLYVRWTLHTIGRLIKLVQRTDPYVVYFNFCIFRIVLVFNCFVGVIFCKMTISRMLSFCERSCRPSFGGLVFIELVARIGEI
jgi:hypothetical protein